MAIRDRGKMKWQGAFFMPEHVKLLGDLQTDYNRTDKPQLDVYQYDEFDERICEAMAHHLPVKVTIWKDGFTKDMVGHVHYIDPLKKLLQIEVGSGQYDCIRFEEMIHVVVME